ncbi:hypothetical protein [Tahibacter harae]|uniref:Bacteriocin resistance YdeI/OmpD-like protein n=1 Tax=Tahibacter harae TaxID=2963937 RepID=A0ABT1QZL5_9GAMM|nr:hypothetical protein [Tahibacter harae]MCQ4167732.1 hypothetical protein [Tahibacter harae]
MKAKLIKPSIDKEKSIWIAEIGEARLGCNIKIGWTLLLKENHYKLVYSNYFIVYPVLELDYQYFFDHISDAISNFSEYSSILSRFPTEEIMRTVFSKSPSSYWPEKAMDWLNFNKPLQLKLLPELEQFAINKAMPQSARNRARSMIDRALAP